MNPDKLRYMSADPEMYREELRQPAAPSTPALAQLPEYLELFEIRPDHNASRVHPYPRNSVLYLAGLRIYCGLEENCIWTRDHILKAIARTVAPAPEPEEWLKQQKYKWVQDSAIAEGEYDPSRKTQWLYIEDVLRAYRASLSAQKEK